MLSALQKIGINELIKCFNQTVLKEKENKALKPISKHEQLNGYPTTSFISQICQVNKFCMIRDEILNANAVDDLITRLINLHKKFIEIAKDDEGPTAYYQYSQITRDNTLEIIKKMGNAKELDNLKVKDTIEKYTSSASKLPRDNFIFITASELGRLTLFNPNNEKVTSSDSDFKNGSEEKAPLQNY